MIQINVGEWLLAEGEIAVRGEYRDVPDLLLGAGGPAFAPGERCWIEQLATKPLRLYETPAWGSRAGRLRLRRIFRRKRWPTSWKRRCGDPMPTGRTSPSRRWAGRRRATPSSRQPASSAWKGLLRNYEASEKRMAAEQGRREISYAFPVAVPWFGVPEGVNPSAGSS